MIVQLELELHAVPVIGIALRDLDAGHGVIRGQHGRVVSVLPVHQRADKGGGVHVARPVAALGDLFVLVVPRLRALAHHHAGPVRGVAHAGEHACFRAESREPVQQQGDIALVIALAVFRVREEAGLGDVRQDDVRAGAQGLHRLDVSRVEGGIEPAVVGHGRIDDLESARLEQRVENVSDVSDLLGGAEIAGVDRVEGDVLLAPVRGDGGDVLGQIAHREAGKARRVRGEHGRGQDAGLCAGGGEDRQRHGQRALAHAGDVLDRQDLRIFHGIPFLFSDKALDTFCFAVYS